MPYLPSPRIGWPICARCALIWWVLPVISSTSNIDVLFLLSSDKTLYLVNISIYPFLGVVTEDKTADSLTKILNKKYTYISPGHRIDRNTTGLVLFAKNPEALEILLLKFKNKEKILELQKEFVKILTEMGATCEIGFVDKDNNVFEF